MNLPISLRLSSRLFSYSLSKVCMGRNLYFNCHQITSSFKYPAPASFSFRKNPCYQFSSQKKTDGTEMISASQKIETVGDQPVAKVNHRTRLKQAVRDYGTTIVVFHVAISLTSLGLCYLAISNGVDAVRFLTILGFSEAIISSKVAVGGSTFVISYAVHKLFAPVRIGITVSVAPFIVRYLRKIKWIKQPKNKV